MSAMMVRSETGKKWAQLALVGGVVLLLALAAYIWGTPLLGDTRTASNEAASYNTLAGVAGVREIDRVANTRNRTEARYATLAGVAAIRALDADRSAASHIASSLRGVAAVRTIDNAARTPSRGLSYLETKRAKSSSSATAAVNADAARYAAMDSFYSAKAKADAARAKSAADGRYLAMDAFYGTAIADK